MWKLPALVILSLAMTATACGASAPAMIDPSLYRDDPKAQNAVLLQQLVGDLNPKRKRMVEFCAGGDDWSCTELADDFLFIAVKHGRKRSDVKVVYDEVYVDPGPPAQTALRLYRSACDHGFGVACFRLGVLYTTHSRDYVLLSQDEPRALELFVEACKATIPSGEACLEAGQSYAYAKWSGALKAEGGPPRDVRRALELWDRGCRAGLDYEMSTGGTLDGGSRYTCELLSRLFGPGEEREIAELAPNEELAASYARLAKESETRNVETHDRHYAAASAYYNELQQAYQREHAARMEAFAQVQSVIQTLGPAIQQGLAANAPQSSSGSAPAAQSGASTPGSCGHCAGTCDARKKACEAGTQRACYEAAACLCRCNRDGGCGDRAALDACISKNEAAAASLKSNAPAVDGSGKTSAP